MKAINYNNDIEPDNLSTVNYNSDIEIDDLLDAQTSEYKTTTNKNSAAQQ